MYTTLAQTTQDIHSSWSLRPIYISMWDNTGSNGERWSGQKTEEGNDNI